MVRATGVLFEKRQIKGDGVNFGGGRSSRDEGRSGLGGDGGGHDLGGEGSVEGAFLGGVGGGPAELDLLLEVKSLAALGELLVAGELLVGNVVVAIAAQANEVASVVDAQFLGSLAAVGGLGVQGGAQVVDVGLGEGLDLVGVDFGLGDDGVLAFVGFELGLGEVGGGLGLVLVALIDGGGALFNSTVAADLSFSTSVLAASIWAAL